jgi:sterol desaturase/sphingolipid hydroxylase (fatty acid hydroxylase superfamily)
VQVLDSRADSKLVDQRGFGQSVGSIVVLTTILFGLLIYGALYIEPFLSAKPDRRPVSVVLLATLLPIGTLVFLSLIELLFAPAGPRKSLRTYLLHLQINIFQYFVAGIVQIPVLMALTSIAHRMGFKLGLIDVRLAGEKWGVFGLVMEGWLVAVIGDFFFYWFHRSLHRAPCLWAHHKMHHMDRELDAITYNRQNWMEQIFAAIFLGIPFVVLFKADELNVWQLGLFDGGVVLVVQTLAAIGHLNVRWQIGKASMFYCTPQVHRIHHSRLPQHHDKNFAFVLPLWDWIFGTYYEPKRDEFPPTGVEEEVEIESFIESQIFTPREWLKMFRLWRDKQRNA